MIINLTVGSIIELLGEGKSNLGHDFVIRKIASLTTATTSDMAVLIDRGDQSVFDGTSLDEIRKSAAALFLAVHPLVEGKNYLLVKDPLKAFQTIIDFITQQTSQDLVADIAPDAVIHPSAVISSGAKIGNKSHIGAHVFVGKDCLIGSQVILHPGAKILDRCVVGDSSIVHAGVVVGSDGFGYQVTSHGLRKIPQVGIVRIGRYVEIGANCAIDRASFDETVVGDGVKIDNSVHIAHNVQIGAGTAILAQTGIAGSVIIGKGCQIGGQVALKNHIRIGNGVKIVSKTGVMTDLEDGAVVAGIPAMPFNQWKRLCVVLTKLPDLIKTFRGGKVDREENRENKSFWRRLFLGRW